ncbi:capsule assembly Wzi family protein [Dyadobacter sp. CY261]|uniref:capsule assembly Wzi family protein n=1 Tax=Dyadobacter sp. CY261 TaxID=2907203 RepID=UPI001F1CD5E0|nr:capsule assembly Wzi family protein [Dyadobacter sp. CY261]MCF0075253.1 capsule assembly Wzi family protein [Dyadobacter sp. CY261]
MRKHLFVLLLCIAYSFKTQAQDSTFFYSATLLGTASTSQVPFWLSNNQNGIIPTKGSFAGIKASFHRVYNQNNPRFLQWSGGVEAVGIAGKNSSVFFTDLFIAGKAGPVELSVGQRKEMIGLADSSSLTSGSFALSQNYRPYPKIQLSTPKFVNIIPGNDIIGFKFTYSDGILGPSGVHYGNVSSVDETYLHHKAFYLKLGKRRHKLNLFAGFNHQVIWGGEDKIFTGGLKRSSAYEYVVFGKSWLSSRVGNHFGTIDLAAEWKGSRWDVFLYRQSIYEDGSLSDLSNVADGLNGLRFKKKSRPGPSDGISVNTVLLELIYTKNQGGAVFDFNTSTFGMDDYFNHYVYNRGWSYKGRTLGSPIIAPQSSFRPELQSSSTLFTPNNRIIAYHLGADISWKDLNFSLKGTHSVNLGTYRRPFSETLHQTSFILNAEKSLSASRKDYLTLSLAADIGKLYPNNMAIMVGWRKSGFIR